jgi:hypothetical protein
MPQAHREEKDHNARLSERVDALVKSIDRVRKTTGPPPAGVATGLPKDEISPA